MAGWVAKNPTRLLLLPFLSSSIDGDGIGFPGPPVNQRLMDFTCVSMRKGEGAYSDGYLGTHTLQE